MIPKAVENGQHIGLEDKSFQQKKEQLFEVKVEIETKLAHNLKRIIIHHTSKV